MELAISVLLGIGLSAAVGFRIFIPFLLVSLSSYMGWWNTPEGMTWMSSLPAVILFATAAVAEITAYYFPFFDNLLDSISMPASVIAGTILTASAMTGDVPPILQWTAGIVAGGGTAGLISAGTALTRGKSSVLTAGLGNPVLSTGEAGTAIAVSLAAIFIPLVTGAAVLIAVFFVLRWLINRATSSRKA